MPKPSGSFNGDMLGNPIVNLGAGVALTDAVNKGQLDLKLNVSEKGQANGVATLDAGGRVTTAQIPPLAYVPTSEKGQANGVATLDATGKVPRSQLGVQAVFDGDMQGARLVNLGTGTAATDGVNRGQMDAQLATKLNASEKGQANGVATLDATGKVPAAQIPSLAYVPTAQKGQANGVASLDAAGKVPASQLPAQQNTAGSALRLSAPGRVDLNSTSEQDVFIDLAGAAKPAFAKMIKVDAIQDDPAVDISAVRWAAGYPVYDEAASTASSARVLIKFATGAGVAATGRARIFFEL